MSKRISKTVTLVLILAVCILFGQLVLRSEQASGISGAIFTTDPTGLLVNGNIYTNALDVYLSGGPGPNAPPTAAGLPDGEYYFQVTDPPGKKLLSTDSVTERKFLVEGGIITEYLGTHNWNPIPEIPGAIVIQLWPFDKTPNKGGVYKAWATPVDKYDPTNPKSFFGFIPQYSKTDNYKVKVIRPITKLILDKFYDVNNNGEYDTGDYFIKGWRIDVKDPLNVTNTYYTPRTIDVTGNPGNYTITEDLPAGWEQTAVAVDGIYKPLNVTVIVLITNGETHSVIYGNREIPTARPPIGIWMSINPIYQKVGNNIAFSWEILTIRPDIKPQKIELKLTRPNGTSFIVHTATNFPTAYKGIYVWTAQLPTGTWWIMVTYYYTYLGTPYTAGTLGSFIVHASQ